MNTHRFIAKLVHFAAHCSHRLGLAPLFFHSALRRRLEIPTHIHFVCHGNIIRSAYAEARLRGLINSEPLISHPVSKHIVISSSGIQTGIGFPADPRAQQIALERGISLKDHKTTPTSAVQLSQAWLVVTMDWKIQRALVHSFPEVAQKTLLLGSLILDEGEGPFILDPYSKNYGSVVASIDRIDRALEKLVEALVRKELN